MSENKQQLNPDELNQVTGGADETQEIPNINILQREPCIRDKTAISTNSVRCKGCPKLKAIGDLKTTGYVCDNGIMGLISVC